MINLKRTSDVKEVHDIPVGVIVTLVGFAMCLASLFLPYVYVNELFGTGTDTIILFGKAYDSNMILIFSIVDAYLVLGQKSHYKQYTVGGGIVYLIFAIRRIIDLNEKIGELSIYDGMIKSGISVYVLLLGAIAVIVGGAILIKTE